MTNKINNKLTKENIKLFARYVVLAFFMFLAYKITDSGYANNIKEIGEVATSAIYGSVFGAITLVIRAHFAENISKD